VGRKETGVFRRGAHRKFIAIRLAKDHGSSGFEPFNSRGIVRRDEIFQNVRAARGAGPSRHDDVFDGDRYARHRREYFAGGDRSVNLLRLGECALRAQAEVSPDLLVLLLDARVVCLRDVNSRGLPRLQELTNLTDR